MGQYTYDDTGLLFTFFVLTLVASALVPATIYSAFTPSDLQKTVSRRKWLALGWVVLGLLVYLGASGEVIDEKLWDPYEILGIGKDSDEVTIKKSFKKLSLRFHPDKVKQSEKADSEAKFIDISKAYKVLTDNETRATFDEFGHPDGKQAFQVGVALPSWLVAKQSSALILIVYGLIFGVALPIMVAQWWNQAKVVSKNQILNNTMGIFYRDFKEDAHFKLILEILSRAQEFQDLQTIRKIDQETWEALVLAIKERMEEMKLPDRSIVLAKKVALDASALASHRVLLLIYAHLLRVESKDTLIIQSRNECVLTAVSLAKGLLQIAVSRNWLNATGNCLLVSQLLVQAVFNHQSPLFQLPYITKDMLKHLKTKKMAIEDIEDFISLPLSDRASMLKNLTSEQIDEVNSVSAKYPQPLIIRYEFAVLGEKAIIPGAIVTLFVKLGSYYGEEPAPGSLDATISHEEVKPIWWENESDREADAYAPHFPGTKKPVWWVGLANKEINRLIVVSKCVGLDTNKIVRLQFQAPPNPGKWTFQILLKSDSFLGVDQYMDADLVVLDHSAAPLIEEEDDISEPDIDSIAGALQQAKEGRVRTEFDDSSDSENENDYAKEDLGTTDEVDPDFVD